MTWYSASNYVVAGGPIAPTTAGQTLAGGWIDELGGWYIDSNNELCSPTENPFYFLLRPVSENSTDYNSQIALTYVAGGNGNANTTYYLSFRVTNPATGSPNCYCVGFSNINGGVPSLNGFAVVAGSLNALTLNVTGSGSVVQSTKYIATASCVQTNSTTTTLTLTITDTSNNVIISATATDTTSALQNITGQTGLFEFQQAGAITQIQTFNDYPALATGYSVTLTGSGAVGTSVTGTVALVGGNALNAALNVAISDSLGSAITPNPVVIAVGATSATFSFYPTVAGTHTLSFLASGGNSGMAKTPSITFTATSGITWNLASNYIVTGGPIAASATPGSIGGGWIDATGVVWDINSSNELESAVNGSNPWNAGMLLRPTAENPTDYNSQLVIYFVAGTGINSGSSYYPVFRVNNPGNSVKGYCIGFTGTAGVTPTIQAYVLNAGAISPLSGLTSSGTGTLVSGTTYIATINCVQTNSTTTTLTLTITSTSGTVITTASITDSTSALQNVTGQTGLFNFDQGGAITQLETYIDYAALASGYSISLSSESGFVNASIQGTITLTGGVSLSNALVVTLSDPLSSTFSPNPVTLPVGSGSTANFTFTPIGSGIHDVRSTFTGGNAGMTAPTAGQTYTANAAGPLIYANATGCVRSPYNWTVSSTSANGLQTWNAGAYLRFYVSNCSSGVTLLLDPASQGLYAYQIDNGPLNAFTGTTVPANGQVNIALPDSGAHVIWVRHFSIPQTAGRWARTLYLGVYGLQLPAGGVVGTSVRGSKNILIYGDSITEGILANNGVDGNPYDYSYLVGEALYLQGFEYGIQACGSGGYSVTGAGSVPPAFTLNNEPETWWDKKDQTYSQLNAGIFSTIPNIILENWGTNDYLSGNTGAPIQIRIVEFWTALRAASPGTLILKIIPFDGYLRSDILAAFNTYQGTTPDLLLIIVDLNFDARLNAPAYFYTEYDVNYHLHPGIWGHANIASQLLPIIQKTYDQQLSPPDRWYHV